MAKGSRFYTRDYLRRRERERLSVEDDHKYLNELYGDDYAEGDFPIDRIENWILQNDNLGSKDAVERFQKKMKATGRTEDERKHILEHLRKLVIEVKQVKEFKLKTGQVVYRDRAGRFTSLRLSEEEFNAVRRVELDQ